MAGSPSSDGGILDSNRLGLASAIANDYGISLVSEPEKVASCQYVARTDRGCYLVRAIRHRSEAGRLFYASAFTDHLCQYGFHAQRILRTSEGKLVAHFYGHDFVLMEYFDGEVAKDNWAVLSVDQIYEAGRELALLHQFSATYNGVRSHKLPFRSGKSIAVLRKAYTAIESRDGGGGRDTEALDAIQQKIEFIRRYPFEEQRFMALRSLVNHGDYHTGNIVFGTDKKVSGVIDFELCSHMPRIWDVCWAIAWLCREGRTEAFTGQIDGDRAVTLLRGYTEISQLDADERHGLVEMAVSASHHAVFFFENTVLNGRNMGLEWCTSADEWFWWRENRRLLQEIVTEGCGSQG